MIIDYARVSTTGLNLDGQTDMLAQAGCERIYSEKDTPERIEMFYRLNKHGFSL